VAPLGSRLRRALLGVARRGGLDARMLAPGHVLLSRRGRAGARVRTLGPGAALVSQPRLLRRDWFEAEQELTRLAVHQHAAAILRLYRVNCVLDVGANRGQYARALRRAGFAGHIVSFEPVPETFARLEEASRADPRWTALPYALGREDGATEMHVVPGTLSSVLAPTRFGAGRYAQLRDPDRVQVPVRRLDGLLDEFLADVADPRPYLKLDTQGFDLEAFAGLGERARDFVGMQSEVALLRIYEGMPRMAQALEAYEAAGFEVTALYPVSRQSRTARVLEFDCVMVRPGAL
jgi:FkbM family methyltransferase